MIEKRILVCGATGFLGRNVSEHLSNCGENFEVKGTYFNSPPPRKSKIDYVKADLRDIRQVEEVFEGSDVVINFASVTGGIGDAEKRMDKYVRDNNIINSNVLSALYSQKISRAILPSCTMMYPSRDFPQKEEDSVLGNELKGREYILAQIKLSLESFAEAYSREGRTEFVIMRHSNIYGPYDNFNEDRSHVFGANLGKIVRANEGDSIKVWGEGVEERDLLYVDDFSRFVESSLSRNLEDSFNLINVGYGESISVKKLVHKMIDISGKELKMEFDPSKPSKNNKILLDISKTRNFGWKPKISLEEGIRRTLDWSTKNLNK